VGQALGQLLPLAIGVALSPVPIIAVILMLFSGRARSNGPAFLLGWLIGIGAVSAVALASADAASASTESEASNASSWVKLAFGVLLIIAALREWRARPADGEETTMPKWMKGIDAFTAPKALGLAALLGALNPKNLLLGAAAGTTIAQADVSSGERWGAWLIFVSLASLSVAIPVLYYLLGGESAQGRLDAWKRWLQQNNTAVMAVLLLVLGAVLVGQSIQTLSA
jgi:threonine/homoserine/homoserine lactone efflux protein